MATTLGDGSLADFVARADVAAVGTVLSVSYVEEDGRPLTVYAFDVEQSLLGAPASTLDLVLLGGPMADGRWLDGGGPTFAVGERLLVHAVPVTSRWRLVSWGAGLLRQRTDVDGVAVTVDGDGVPLASLPCTERADAVPTMPATRTDDAAAARTSRALAAGGLHWEDAVGAVTNCIAERGR
ncbi:MAG: hypothetical protein R3F59_22945 [Myxococcota bacterium]